MKVSLKARLFLSGLLNSLAVIVFLVSARLVAADEEQPPSNDLHLECVMLEECADGHCEEIEAAPILLRFVRFPDILALWGIGSPKIVGGPDSDVEDFSGLIVRGAKSILLTNGQHGQRDNLFWLDPYATDGGRQRLFAKIDETRFVEGYCASPAEMHPGQPERLPKQIANGFKGYCIWAKELCPIGPEKAEEPR